MGILQSAPIADVSNAWCRIVFPYAEADIEAYHDPNRINPHFGLPLPFRHRVFAIWMDKNGLMVRDPEKPVRKSKRGLRVIGGDFGNLVAYRGIKRDYPEAWIWAERYTFTEKPAIASCSRDQNAFIQLIGRDRLREVERRARELGLNPEGKTKGRPDLAVYIPGLTSPWRFIELKKKGKDYLSEEQKRWLTLLASAFGKESAVEATLVLSTGSERGSS